VSSASLESIGPGRYRVGGALTFATVRDTLRDAQEKFIGAAGLEIDLSAVSASDTAGLALLIEWYRTASKSNQSIRFVGVPAQLRALAKISEVDRLLPFND
jgi:phospholipid transport system transporter-binding protein